MKMANWYLGDRRYFKNRKVDALIFKKAKFCGKPTDFLKSNGNGQVYFQEQKTNFKTYFYFLICT